MYNIRFKILFLYLCFYFTPWGGQRGTAQDIHFSQFSNTPLLSNPARTGNFNGDYRLGAIYRNQWKSFTVPFKTYSFFADHKIKKQVIQKDFLGAGIAVYSDKSGTAELSTLSATANVAYHKKLGAEDQHLVSIAAHVSYVQKSFDYSNLKFQNQYQSINFVPDMPSGESFSTESFQYPDFGAGVQWNSHPTEKISYNIGSAIFHLAEPPESFYKSKDNRLNKRISINGEALFQLTPQWIISPGFLFQTQANDQELNIGGYAERELKKTALTSLSAFSGLYGRFSGSDAIIWMAGLEIDNWRGALSYDFNTSSLTNASNGKGAVELSLIYIFNTKPSIGIPKTIPCKRL